MFGKVLFALMFVLQLLTASVLVVLCIVGWSTILYVPSVSVSDVVSAVAFTLGAVCAIANLSNLRM